MDNEMGKKSNNCIYNNFVYNCKNMGRDLR